MANTFNNEIEESVLACPFKRDECFSGIIDILDVKDFYWQPHSWMYEAFINLHRSGLAIDVISVTDEMRRMNRLDAFASPMSDIRGVDAVKRIAALDVNPDNADSYAARCHDASANRKFLSFCENGKSWVENGFDAITVLTKAETSLSEISAYAGINTKTITPIGVSVDEAIAQTEFAAKGSQKYIETGIKALDSLIGGMFPGQQITIAGRQGQGKSSLAKTIALNVSTLNKWKKKVGIFTLEMKNKEYTQRMISALTGIPSFRLKTGKIFENEWEKYSWATNLLKETGNMVLDDTVHLTVPQLRTKLRKMKDWGIELVILDQIGLMKRVGHSNDQEYAWIDKLSYECKNLGREFDVPFLSVQQMSRSIENYQRKDKEPKASDLSQAGESSPDIIMMIDNELKGKVIVGSKIWVVKNRDGATGYVPVKFENEKTMFRDLTPEEKGLQMPQFVQEGLPNA